MKILLIDNGSSFLQELRHLLHSHEITVMGFPFVPELLAKRAAGVKVIVFSGEAIPAGIELPYKSAVLEAFCQLSTPVCAIGYGGALFLEAHGAKIKIANGEYQIKKNPPGWKIEDGVWHDEQGNTVVFDPQPDWKKVVETFLMNY